MTGHDRRQTRKAVASHRQANPPAPKPTNNRVWEQPEPVADRARERAAQGAPDMRPLTVEFTALRLLESMVRKDGRSALCAEAARDCVHTARVLISEAMKP